MNTFTTFRLNPGLWFRIFAVTACATLLAVPASAQLHVRVPDAAQTTTPSNPEAAAKATAISPAEKKLSFNLLLLARMTRKAAVSPVDAMLDASTINADGTVNVEIDAYFSPSLMTNPVILKVVAANGGSIPILAYESDRLFVKVHPSQLLDIASNPNVQSIRQTTMTAQATNINPTKTAAR